MKYKTVALYFNTSCSVLSDLCCSVLCNVCCSVLSLFGAIYSIFQSKANLEQEAFTSFPFNMMGKYKYCTYFCYTIFKHLLVIHFGYFHINKVPCLVFVLHFHSFLDIPLCPNEYLKTCKYINAFQVPTGTG